MGTTYVVKTIDLNIIPYAVITPQVSVSQYDGDNTRLIKANIYNGDSLYVIPTSAKVIVSGTKQDIKGFSYFCTYNGSVVNIPVMRQMTYVAGPVTCEVTFFDSDDNQIGTANFILNVEKAALKDTTLVSSHDFQTFASYVSEALYYSMVSKSYAVGLTTVRPEEDTDNSRYYYLLSKQWAEASRRYVGITPLSVQSASDMTDEDAVYIYTGSESGYTTGDWYYYDGTNWTSGGQFIHASGDLITFSIIGPTSEIVIE